MPVLKETDLKKQIKNKEVKGAYILYGEEKYLISYYRDLITGNETNSNKKNSFNFQKFDGDAADIDEIICSVESLPLFCDRKYVLVNDINLDSISEKDLEKLELLISDIPEFCILIFAFPTLVIDLKKSSKFKKFIKKSEKYANIIKFEKRSRDVLIKQLISWSKKLNCQLDNVCADKIIRDCGDDLLTIKNEFEKLYAFSNGQPITEDMIDKVVTKNLETTVFILSKAISCGDYGKAYKQLDILFNNREEPIAILAVLASAFIDMYRVRVCLESGEDPYKLTEYFDYKNKEFRIKNAIRDSKRLSVSMLRECLNVILNTDISLKSTIIDKRLLMDKMLAKLLLIYEGKGSY